MRFQEVSDGDAFALRGALSMASRPILRKLDARSATDDSGARIQIDFDQQVDLLDSVTLTHAMWVLHNNQWKLVLRWTSPDEETPNWTSVDPDEERGEEESATGDRKARVLLASGLHAQGELVQALKIYDGLIDEAEEASLLNNRGAARASHGDVTGAVIDYTRALALDTRLAQAYSNRGNAFTKLGKYEQAITDYDRALELAGDVAPIYCNRGLTRKMVGDLNGSLEDFDTALAIDGAFAAGYLARGGVRALSADLEGAVLDLERFLALAPEAPQVRQVRLAVGRLRTTLQSQERPQ